MKNVKGKILVVGPITFDTIKNKRFYGGTAANIAYGLGILGAKPILFSAAGHDFLGSYEKHLKKNKVDLRVHIDKKNRTACFLKETGEKNVWHPNACENMAKISIQKFFSEKDLENVAFAIFSSYAPRDTVKHMEEFKKVSKNAMVIFDPGQTTKSYSKKDLKKCLSLCDLVILNEFEYVDASKILGIDMNKFLFNANKIIIETKGGKGSEILFNKKKIKIPAIYSKHVIDAIGAGDAYRAGLIFGLSNGMNLTKSCKLGARVASKNVEFLGCQQYNFLLK